MVRGQPCKGKIGFFPQVGTKYAAAVNKPADFRFIPSTLSTLILVVANLCRSLYINISRRVVGNIVC